MTIYDDIVVTAAREAAGAATDAHGEGNAPPAIVAYDFIRTLWNDLDEPAAAYLTEQMPVEFATEYDRLVGGSI
jgi:hypothetical protein